MPYAVEIIATAGCGCELEVEFLLDEEPEAATVGEVLAQALDPDETPLLQWMTTEKHKGGHEKFTITAQVKVR